MMNNNPQRLHESIRRFSAILSETEIKEILKIQQQPLPPGIRINRLKVTPKKAIQDLVSRYGWQVKPIPFCDNAWTINNAETSPGITIEHRMGQYYLQDAASIVPVSLFTIEETHPLILDIAASPGGKTTHLIDRTLDKGFILANDASKGRIAGLRSVLSAWGGCNIAVTNFPGESFGAWYPETFDFILLDVPCSMENLRPTVNHPLRETTTDERLRLQERQIQLLTSGLQSLKLGGQLVYATCSLAPEEDEAVIDALMKAFPSAFAIENVSTKLGFEAPGLTQFDDELYHQGLVHALRLWPHRTGMSGFFCALLTKTKTIPKEREIPPTRDFSRTDLEMLKDNLKAQVYDQISANFGLNMSEILENYGVELFRRHDQLFLIPKQYLDHFITLPYAFIGMTLGRWFENNLEPSHEFISRFGHQFTDGMICIDNEKIEQWIAGRDIRQPSIDLKPEGQYLLVTDQTGRNLGMGKLLPKRLRNMLPRQSI